jgi:hypothetical protein
MNHLVVAATICLILFTLLGSVDGIYFHLWKYRLYARAGSLWEHKLHTIRALLFIPMVWLLFVNNYGGLLLWSGLLVVAADLVVEMMDVLCERESRASTDGLSTGEYATHVAATSLRVTAIALILAAKPISAWSLSAPLVIAQSYPAWVGWLAVNLLPGAVIGVGLHLWLMRGKYRLQI